MKIEINIKGDDYGPLTPMNFANAMVGQELFKTAELKELAEYLLVYCKHNVTDNGTVCREEIEYERNYI